MNKFCNGISFFNLTIPFAIEVAFIATIKPLNSDVIWSLAVEKLVTIIGFLRI